MEEDITGFMPKDTQSERINFVYKNLAISDKIIIRFGSKDSTRQVDKDQLISAAERFATVFDSISGNRRLVKSVLYKVDQQQLFGISGFIAENIPLFLEEADYLRMDTLLAPGKIKEILANDKRILVSPAGMILKKNIIADPLHLSGSVLNRLKSFQVSDQYQIYNDYIFSKKKPVLMCFITSAFPMGETAKNEELVECLDQSVKKVQENLANNVNITYFGSVPVAVTNARQIKHDTMWSVIVSVALILLLLGWFFKSGKAMALIAVPVLFGGILSMAALYFIKGSISAIAIGAGSIIFGIAINYSMHYLIHRKHEPDAEKTLKEIASPMIIGSITTVGAFLSLLFISADAMRDFGLFAAFTLAGTLLFVLIFLPHFSTIKSKPLNPLFDKISGYRFEKKKIFPLLLVVLTVVFFFFSYGVQFDSDMNKINYMTAEQRKAFEELSNVSTLGKKNIYLVSEGRNLEQALREYEKESPEVDRLTRTGQVISASGIGTFLPSDSLQRIKIGRWNKFWKSRKEMLKKELVKQGTALGFKPESFSQFFGLLDNEFTPQPPAFFAPITENLAKEYLITKENRAMVVTVLYTTPANSAKVSDELTRGKSFVFDQSGISKLLINILSNDFNTVLYICSLLVIIFLTFSFGRFELSLISFLPMLISWIWILGIMALFHINFNIVNIILASFIFGLGDDYTIFMMDGMMNEYAYRRKLLTSYKTAVGLSAITMFIGIGTLVFAHHPALRSLGSVTVVGMISVVMVAYIVPPLLFNYLTLKKNQPRLIPITLKQQFCTIYSFAFFILGSIYLTLTGFVLLTIRKKTEKNKLRFHRQLNGIFKFIVRNIPLVKTRIINNHNEAFERPSVIICNHQSHLDLMYILMLSPKIVVLTNDWVWKSPFYGRIIRYADFYPVANGIENSVDQLATLVDRGYSIVIFPEGTRSADCSILRFHRGAFYLAEKLHLDILPIVIHGVGHAFPKKEFLLRKGEVTVKFLERIKPENTAFGVSYQERTKSIRKLYQKEYDVICDECETAGYYADKVLHNYIYKGVEVERSVRKSLKRYDNFSCFIEMLPLSGKMLHLNCGWGEWSLLTSLVRKDTEIIATDQDEDKIALAENCASKPENLRYIVLANSSDFFAEADAVVEMQPHDKSVLEKCILLNKKYFALIDAGKEVSLQVREKDVKIQQMGKYSMISYQPGAGQ